MGGQEGKCGTKARTVVAGAEVFVVVPTVSRRGGQFDNEAGALEFPVDGEFVRVLVADAMMPQST